MKLTRVFKVYFSVFPEKENCNVANEKVSFLKGDKLAKSKCQLNHTIIACYKSENFISFNTQKTV